MSNRERDNLKQNFNSLYEGESIPTFRYSWARAEIAHSEQHKPLLHPALVTALSIFILIMITMLVNQEPPPTQPEMQTVAENTADVDWEFSTDFLLTLNNDMFYYTDFLLEISDDSTLTSVPDLESSLLNESQDI